MPISRSRLGVSQWGSLAPSRTHIRGGWKISPRLIVLLPACLPLSLSALSSPIDRDWSDDTTLGRPSLCLSLIHRLCESRHRFSLCLLLGPNWSTPLQGEEDMALRKENINWFLLLFGFLHYFYNFFVNTSLLMKILLAET